MELKILDRYVIKKFLLLFLVSLLTFLVIFHIVDVIEKIDKFLKSEMSFMDVLIFYYYQLPWFIDIAIPMSLLLAAVFTIGSMGKSNELGAIKSSGISLYRLTAPLLMIGLLFSVGQFFFEDAIVIPASRKRIDIEQNQMKRHRNRQKFVYTNVMFQDSPTRNIVITRFDTRNNIGNTITIQQSRDNILIQRIDARKMQWQPEVNAWLLTDFKIREFDPEGQETVTTTISDSLFTFNLRPEDVTQTSLDPEGMRYSELAYFIKRLEDSGNDPRKWKVNLHYKIAFPFTNFIVILFGLPLAALKERKGISFGAGMSLLIIFIYYGFIKFGQVMGYRGILNPLLAVWIGNIVFLGCGASLLYKIRQ
jgi:lipopolysaccharide export system permease protein